MGDRRREQRRDKALDKLERRDRSRDDADAHEFEGKSSPYFNEEVGANDSEKERGRRWQQYEEQSRRQQERQEARNRETQNQLYADNAFEWGQAGARAEDRQMKRGGPLHRVEDGFEKLTHRSDRAGGGAGESQSAMPHPLRTVKKEGEHLLGRDGKSGEASGSSSGKKKR